MKAIFLLLASIFLSSCATQRKMVFEENILTLKDSYCKAPEEYQYDVEIPSYNSDSILTKNQHLKPYFKDQSILILNALGSIDEVEQIIHIKENKDIESRLKIVQLKNVITFRITKSLNEVDAIAAEFDCEGERVSQMASFVDNLNNRKNNKMVFYSIIAGAVASISSGLIKNDKLGTAIDIGGGVIGAGLSFATFSPKGRKVEFIHNRNLLRDVWSEKQISPNFPPFVWYMFTEKKFSNDGQYSIIYNMKQRWLRYQFENNIQEAEQSILFDNGGMYYSEDLHNRASMLNQMQSVTRKINQNFNYLLLDLDKLVL